MTAVMELEAVTREHKQKTQRLTVAQALVRFLAVQQVEQLDGTFQPLCGGIFGIFGHGNVACLGEALYEKREELPYLRGQNEQGMAHAAIAYAKAHHCRRIMGVTTSIGPGATNLVTACALAHVNRLPVLFLPGDVFASRRPDPVLQQLEDERAPLKSVNACLEPVSRYFDTISRPEQLLASLPRVVRVLMDPLNRGPVTLSLPQDVQGEAYDFPVSFFEPVKHYLRRQRPDSREVERCVQLLSRSERPLMIVGGGVHYSGACREVQVFAEKHGIPVGETQAGKGVLPFNHPLAMGGIGVTGTRAANAVAREADLVLCVGTRLSDFTTASKSLFADGAKCIGINVSEMDASKLNAETLLSDSREGIVALSNELKDWSASDAYRASCQRLHAAWREERKQVVRATGETISDAQVLAAVNAVADEQCTVVCAAGGLPGELHKLWDAKSTMHYHVEYGFSCMGYEIAGGLGVKLAHPEREVYVLVGDGSYLMLHTELVTARQLGLKINVLVVDNHGFGCINRLQQACGSPSFGNLQRTPAGEPLKIDFVANAASYGCHARKAGSIEELKRILIENKALDEVCVTVIETDPSLSTSGSAWWDVALPEVSKGASVRDAYTRYREDLGRLH